MEKYILHSKIKKKKNNLWSLSAENSKQDILSVYDPSY